MPDDHATDEASDDEPREVPSDDADEAFESERTATRAEAAAALRDLADGVDAGAVALGEGEDALTAAVPDAFEFEVEYEREDDEVEIEVELEWAPGDEPGEPGVDSANEAIDASESGEGDEPAAERPAVETATVAAAGAEPVAETAGSESADGEAGSDDSGAEPDDSDAEPAADEEPAAEADGSSDTVDDSAVTVPGVAPTGERPAASVVAAAAPVVSQARFELFRDRADEWRWRLVHRNGNVIASSGEGYTRKHNAEKGMRSVMANASGAEVVED
ncbi:HVO_2922 family protein [Halosimplex pelagicum]|uniref:YegP family protein n=1 Tax=Halosimplex pelagicum TaxID=869886 RepID=A0A7D5TQ33_9EURY|nr:YegP family protein [Halosimplex pelagicum]